MTPAWSMGMTDEERLAFEEATGIKSEGAQAIVEASVQQAQELMRASLREVQEVIGPHGSVSRLQAGGVRITPGQGIGVFEDGVLKTTIGPDGNFYVGSDITQPATTTLAAFVNDQVYNGEEMGAGDLLIGDNSEGTSNVKFDASEGQLQFRFGLIVNVYMDTDGSLKAGAGAVTLDSDGILLQEAGDAIIFYSASEKAYAVLSQSESVDNAVKIMRLLSFELSSETNLVTNGDFELGSLSGWTEVDSGSNIAISDIGEGYNGGYAVEFGASSTLGDYIEQAVSLASFGYVVSFRIKTVDGYTKVRVIGGSTRDLNSITSAGDWRTYYMVVPGSTTNFRIAVNPSTATSVLIDDIVVRPLDGLGTTTFASQIDIAGNVIQLISHIVEITNLSNDSILRMETDGAGKSIIFNDDKVDIDTIVRGDTDNNLLYMDASTDRVGIGKSTPTEKLDVLGNIVASGTVTGTNVTTEALQDLVGAMVTGNVETGIDATYDDTNGKLNFDAQTAGDARYAPIAKGVTNGDSHNHVGGDGGQVAHGDLSSIGTNSHATIDTHLAASAPHTGHAKIITNSSISPTTADQTAAVNTRYFADVSGLTADRNFKLPAGTAGDIIEIRITTGDDTFEFILKGDTSITINGGASATEWSRLFITGEVVIFVASSTTNWNVMHDGRIPCVGQMDRITSSLTTNTAATQTTPDWNNAPIDVGNLCDLTNDRFNIRRAGKYTFSGSYVPNTGITDQKYARLYFLQNGTNVAHAGNRASAAAPSSLINVAITKTLVCAINDAMLYQYAPEEANRGMIHNGTAGFEGSNYFEVVEILPQ